MTKRLNLEAMSIDEMWQLHERIIQVLSDRLMSEKRELERRLAKLRKEKDMPRPTSHDQGAKEKSGEGRKIMRAFPRYRNPDDPTETWSGRGRQPRWLAAALTNGRTIDEFRIATSVA